MKKELILENIRLGKLVHGGQCIAESPEGKKLFVWGGLPGELANVQITKKKSSFQEGIVTKIHQASPDRVEPEEPLSYLSTSPWQIMSTTAEVQHKTSILREAFEREHVEIESWSDFEVAGRITGYRNKMELGFWGDDDGLHLAHYVRGTHAKQIVEGRILASDYINNAALTIRDELRRLGVWSGKLKTLLIRSSQAGEVVVALFIKEELELSDFRLPDSIQGVNVYYSDPISPASVATKKLYSFGDINLTDTIGGKNITYDVLSFFQVNLPMFEHALEKIRHYTAEHESVDFYSGVGTIGLCVGSKILVESDKNNIAKAKENAEGTKTEVIAASSEAALDYITKDKSLIVDPPRAGLHKTVIDKINDIKPPRVVYLSCNPSTQARDVKLLEEQYRVIFAQGFNFFPRTPHIESLIVLELRS